MPSKALYHRDPDERRLKILRLSENGLIDILLSKENLRIESELPEDVKIKNVSFDINTSSFNIVLKSSEYGEVQEGEQLPYENSLSITPLEVWKKQKIQKIKE